MGDVTSILMKSQNFMIGISRLHEKRTTTRSAQENLRNETDSEKLLDSRAFADTKGDSRESRFADDLTKQ